MGKLLRFSDAVRAIGNIALAEDDDRAIGVQNQMEAVVLRHYPENAEQASAILTILLSNIEPGVRSDGLDIIALRNIKSWCESLTNIVSTPCFAADHLETIT